MRVRTPSRRRAPTGTPKPTRTPRPIGIPRPTGRQPTSQQRAAMRRQNIARFGTAATRQKRQDAGARRAVRQGYVTPGQVRSFKQTRLKLAQGKFAPLPKRTTKRKSRRLV